MVNYIHNSSICGYNTPYQSSSFSYYIFMGVKIAGEYNEPNYKQFTTMIPWIDFEKEKIDFAEYFKQNLDYQLSITPATTTETYQNETSTRMRNIYVATPLREKPQRNMYTQYNLFFTDDFTGASWMNNALFYSNQGGVKKF
uniref:Uncharacterized protein n=1 Tax=Panagrolaimus davidi TaxID=227884 RepID=A0A914Q051_9BILA